MSDPKSTSGSLSDRYERYFPIVEEIAKDEFVDAEELKSNLSDVRPATITRTINELVNQGWLVHEDANGRANRYRWNRSRGDFEAKKWLDQKIFGSQVKATPANARPREKLLDQGVERLTIAELVAILVRSGRPGESAIEAGQKVAAEFEKRIGDLASAGRGELKSISSAIEKTAFCQIMAGIELGRRIAEAEPKKVTKISGSADAIAFCETHFYRLTVDKRQEEFHIITLDTKNQVIDTHQISIGTLDASLVHPREVFRAAIKDAAASIVLVHNHPSGDPSPSREDHQVTARLTECGKTLGIDVLDHIILGNPKSMSIHATV